MPPRRFDWRARSATFSTPFAPIRFASSARAAAPLEKLKKVFRQQLLIKSSSRPALHEALRRLQGYLEEQKVSAGKVIVDIDPVSLL